MTALINIHPPLITVDEMRTSPVWCGFHDTLSIRGEILVPVTEFAVSKDIRHLSENLQLDGDVRTDGLLTAGDLLVWEYFPDQRNIVLRLAESYDVRAVDAADLVAHKIFPRARRTRLRRTTGHEGPQATEVRRPQPGILLWEHDFPLSVSAPAWFPKRGMPKNIVFSRQ